MNRHWSLPVSSWSDFEYNPLECNPSNVSFASFSWSSSMPPWVWCTVSFKAFFVLVVLPLLLKENKPNIATTYKSSNQFLDFLCNNSLPCIHYSWEQNQHNFGHAFAISDAALSILTTNAAKKTQAYYIDKSPYEGELDDSKAWSPERKSKIMWARKSYVLMAIASPSRP